MESVAEDELNDTSTGQLTVIVSDSNFSGSTPSKAIRLSYCSLKTADAIRNILSYLSNYCKALLILINIVVVDSEELS